MIINYVLRENFKFSETSTKCFLKFELHACYTAFVVLFCRLMIEHREIKIQLASQSGILEGF